MQEKSHAAPPLLLCALLVATCSSPPDSVDTGGNGEADTLDPISAYSDGGDIRMNAPTRERLVAEDPLWAEALRIHYDAIVMDGHIDTPSRMVDDGFDFGTRHTPRQSDHHVDIPKMFEGGLDAPFFSIYVSSRLGEGSEGTTRALAMIAEVKRQVAANIEQSGMAYSAEDVVRLTRSGRKAILMGLEGGHALQASEEVLEQLYDAGISYVTLTHTGTHSWADASQSASRHGGLSDRGRELVRAMNRLGMLVDLSHVSDSTLYDALEVAEAPVILSHSSARALVNNVRNVDDAMLSAVAENGGVVMINFFDPMVNGRLTDEVMETVYERLQQEHQGNLNQIWPMIRAVRRDLSIPEGTLEDILNHIDHVVHVAGVDHVGLGSDFDGVSSLPEGMEDVTRLPWITYGLLKRGYSEGDVRKILGGNTLRVMEEAKRVASDLTD